MTKLKRILLIATVLLASATAAVMIYFFWFTPSGYRISVSIHGFSKLTDHVYVCLLYTSASSLYFTFVIHGSYHLSASVWDFKTNQLLSCINTGFPGYYHPIYARPAPMSPGVHSHFTIIA